MIEIGNLDLERRNVSESTNPNALDNPNKKKRGSLYNMQPPYDKLPGLVCTCGTVIQVGTVWRGPWKPENTLAALSRPRCAIIHQHHPVNVHSELSWSVPKSLLWSWEHLLKKKNVFFRAWPKLPPPDFPISSNLVVFFLDVKMTKRNDDDDDKMTKKIIILWVLSKQGLLLGQKGPKRSGRGLPQYPPFLPPILFRHLQA